MLRPRTVAVVVLLAVPLVAGGFLIQTPPPARGGGGRLFEQVRMLVETRFVDSMRSTQVMEKAAHGLVRELNDPYSELLSPQASESFNRTTNGRYGGTGMLLEDDKEAGVSVARVFPHTPAEEAGVTEGDRITAVDGKATRGWPIDKVSEALRGDPGSPVTVTYARGGVSEPIVLHFIRRVVHIPAVPYSTALDGDIGYVPLQTFNENAAQELQESVEQLVAKGAKGVVLDMRDNGGGIVEQALAVSSLFLQDGQPIVSVRSRTAADEVATARGPHLGVAIPLVVLIDGSSASATEIVAGALQDHDRALIVGTTSFGKGLVQSVYPLDGGYYLKMTTGKWFTPSGRSIHRERKMLPDGRFVETHPDSLESDSSRLARPRFRSDEGRIVFGGGGITPDVIVRDDTLTTAEQSALRALAPKAQIVQSVLQKYAMELRGTVSRDFVAPPSWASEVLARLAAAGVTVAPEQRAAASSLLGREIERRVTRLAFGDGAARARDLATDRPLREAVTRLRHAASQRELLAAARASAPAGS